MGEIWSCVKPRCKLNGVLTDEERKQLLEIYDTLQIDQNKPVKIGRLRTQLYYVIIDLKKRGKLFANLWQDWQELNFHLRHTLLKQPDQEEVTSRLGFLHLWKTFGSKKRHVGTDFCCSTSRQLAMHADYDEQQWKLNKLNRLLDTKTS